MPSWHLSFPYVLPLLIFVYKHTIPLQPFPPQTNQKALKNKLKHISFGSVWFDLRERFVPFFGESKIYEQHQQQQQLRMDVRKNAGHVRRKSVTEEERLEIVDLSGLALDVLPNPSLNLGAVCKLDLSNNNLQNIPESLTARLINMVVFDLHSNQLKSLPNSIGCLSKLKILNVSGNLIEALPKSIENCRYM